MSAIGTGLRVARDGDVAHVVLARPERHNAFEPQLIGALQSCFQQLGADPALRVIVLGAEGETFCSGADLGWMRALADADPEAQRQDARQLGLMLDAVASCSKPVIARVQGDAWGGGVGLIAACDLALGLEACRFALSEVRLGLIAATIMPYLLRAIGPRQCARYCLSAERFDAAEAQRIGLLHVCAADAAALDAALERCCSQLLAGGPRAQTATKRLLAQAGGRALDADLLQLCADQLARVRGGDEAREGIDAFLQRRPPGWRGG